MVEAAWAAAPAFNPATSIVIGWPIFVAAVTACNVAGFKLL
jgi:hypothetical protein